MADYTVYEGVTAYAKQVLIGLAQSAAVAVFNDPNSQVLTIKGKETAIREITTKGAGDYTGSWGDGFASAEVRQRKYYAPYDRGFSASIDTLKEAQSYVEGATPSLIGVANHYLKNELAPEIDRAILANYANEVDAASVHTNSDSGWGVGSTDILGTLAAVEADIANAGYVGDIVCFLSATVNKDFQKALTAANIIANYEVIKRDMTREGIAEGFEPLQVEIRVRRYNNLLIIPVPDNRMCGKVLMLNGINPGQENGGCIPLKNSSSYFDINILAIPMPAAFANIRHIINQLFVPYGLDVADYQQNIETANEKLFGVVALENCGINQQADGFKFNSRCVYGGDIFNIYRDACVLVKGATQAQTVAPVKATCVAAASALSGAKTTTSDVKVAFEELNCSGTVYFVSKTTASATVDASETLTVPTSGEDLRPYCSPTVTFGNTAGTSVIEVHTGSASGPKIGEFTVTSEG